MSTDLDKLKVSLTKFGAHKLAYLVIDFDKDEVINHIEGDHKEIVVDRPQAQKILSLDKDNKAPNYWNEIKKFGQEDINDLMYFSIVLSHIDLINSIIQGFEDGAIIHKGKVIDGKAFTNLKRITIDLGFSIEDDIDFFTYDISRIFYKFYLNKFFYKLIEIKLQDAGWENENKLIDECIRLGLNKVFNLNDQDFKSWLELNQTEVFAKKITKPKRQFENGINFSKGHQSKFDGEVEYDVNPKRKRQLIHNKIQNNVYELLCKEYPKDEIGTEIKTNVGSVDIVRKSNDQFIFYEIKTAKTVKSSIRQAISQLLEYAYWNTIENVSKLVIIAPNKSRKTSLARILCLEEKGTELS